MKKRGFTYIEFVLSIIIMFLIAASVIPILFKKKKKTEPIRKVSKQRIYDCDTNYSGDIIFAPTNPDGSVVYDPEKNEFFTITLIGGGANRSENGKAGSPGEAKEITLPSMPGRYKIVLGRAGASPGNDGGVTSISRCNDNLSTCTRLEYARGGISSNEDPETNDDRISRIPIINDSENRQCGRGGGTRSSGGGTVTPKSGEVIIEWR